MNTYKTGGAAEIVGLEKGFTSGKRQRAEELQTVDGAKLQPVAVYSPSAIPEAENLCSMEVLSTTSTPYVFTLCNDRLVQYEKFNRIGLEWSNRKYYMCNSKRCNR